MAEGEARRGISQPPHSTGQRFKGLRSLLDPSQIPSAASLNWEDYSRWRSRQFDTCDDEAYIPLGSSDYTAFDQGNASTRFARFSAYAIPYNQELASSSGVPLGFVLQPFPDQPEEEALVSLAVQGKHPVPRCEHCGAYINPWVTWTASGQKWSCNLCDLPNDVSPEYYSPLDAAGYRLDHGSRPELLHGVVDFAVSKPYYANQATPRLLPSYTPAPDVLPRHANDPETRLPSPLHTLIAIDVSSASANTGVLRAICESVRETLFGGSLNDPTTESSRVDPRMKIGLMTFDSTLHFYDLSPELTQPSMLVVPDVDDVFTPARSGLFIDPAQSRVVLESLLKRIPDMFGAPPPDSAVCAALRGSLAALSRTGGQALLFASTLCNFGPGILQPRNERELYGTTKERTLFEPQDLVWSELGAECADAGVGVNLWVFPERYIDLASVSAVAVASGGSTFFHPRFNPTRDLRVLSSEVSRVLTRPMGYDCTMKTRCSKGLSISSYITAFPQPSSDTLTAGTITADISVSGSLSVDGTLDDRGLVHIQAATLYTTPGGERRVRVCNSRLKCSTFAGNVFKYADIEATVCLLAKQAALSMETKMLSEIRDEMIQKYVDILLAYRRNCAASTPPTQLILPDSFKLLPVYGNAIVKNQALKGGSVQSDARVVARQRILAMGCPALMTYLYPRFFAVHDLAPDTAFPDSGTSRFNLPAFMPASYLWMEPDGAYLMDNGEITILWLGGSVSPQILIDLFGQEDWESLGPSVARLPVLDTRLSNQVRNIILHEENRRGGRAVPFMIARQNLDAAELEFGNLLVEDQNNDAMSYLDYLCHLHRNISDALLRPTSWNPW